jgi:hypothetical protein
MVLKSASDAVANVDRQGVCMGLWSSVRLEDGSTRSLPYEHISKLS